MLQHRTPPPQRQLIDREIGQRTVGKGEQHDKQQRQ
jgi:hypothetical protein